MQEISDCSKNFDLHKSAYIKIKSELEHLYQNYSNSLKIIALFEYWIFSLGTLHRCYGFSGLADFLCGKHTDPISYSHLKEFEMKTDTSFVMKNRGGLTLLVDKFFSIGYRLPGAPSDGFFSKLKTRYTKLLVSQLPCIVDINLNSKLSKLINIYLKHLNIYLSTDMIRSNIPIIFKSKQIKCCNVKSSKLLCAPMEIIQFQGYERILLLNRKVNLVGYAHGGGYDVGSNDPLTYFEKKISDIFFGWGFSEQNIYQTRYVTDENSFKETNSSRIIWIESSKVPKFTFYCYPLLFILKIDSNIPLYIYKELVKSDVQYLSKTYPGKLRSDRYKNYRGSVISSNQPVEELLRKNDIVILDDCMHSLMYYCLENNILFLIVDKKSSVKHYSPKMLLWYKILRKNNLIFHDHESGFLSRRLKSIDITRGLPAEVYNYYKNVFDLTI